jgi:hypothetical protein
LFGDTKVGWSYLGARERRFAKFLARGLSDDEIYEELGGLYRRSAIDRVIRLLMSHTNTATRGDLVRWIAANRPDSHNS